jgi:tricorn protease-like protein
LEAKIQEKKMIKQLLLIFALFLLAHVTASFAVTNGKIAFTKNAQIYTVDPDGTNISSPLAFGDSPDWSPDGSKFAIAYFIGGNNWDIVVMNADGSNPVNITNDPAFDYSPRWSPDGTKIAFHSDRNGGDFEIYTMNPDGSSVTNLTNDAAFWQGTPRWSPDGTKIAYWTQTSADTEIFVMNADGTNQTNVSNNTRMDFDPAWSPGGNHIAFTSNGEIYVMDSDGLNQVNLTNSSSFEGQPVYSPDGTKIAFSTDRDGLSEIYVIDADGTNPTNLTNDDPTGADIEPAWAAAISSVCPQPQGYWKNTPQAWPVVILTLATQQYTQAELIYIMQLSNKKDASLTLAQQLIAAKLNALIGVDAAPVQSTIANADALLVTFSGKLPYGVQSKTGTGQSMVSYSGTLDQFNKGYLTAGCQ